MPWWFKYSSRCFLNGPTTLSDRIFQSPNTFKVINIFLVSFNLLLLYLRHCSPIIGKIAMEKGLLLSTLFLISMCISIRTSLSLPCSKENKAADLSPPTSRWISLAPSPVQFYIVVFQISHNLNTISLSFRKANLLPLLTVVYRWLQTSTLWLNLDGIWHAQPNLHIEQEDRKIEAEVGY